LVLVGVVEDRFADRVERLAETTNLRLRALVRIRVVQLLLRGRLIRPERANLRELGLRARLAFLVLIAATERRVGLHLDVDAGLADQTHDVLQRVRAVLPLLFVGVVRVERERDLSRGLWLR